jgi:sulfite reductase beta subunit-like hemoprotein
MSRGIEELKKEVGGLEVWSHIEEASKQGFDAVNQELVPLFKWYGIYSQKPPTDGYFMIRIKIPGGILSTKQLFKLNELAERYGRGCADITTRQAIQLHWIRIENIPEILSELKSVGMDTAGGCGDILRNVTGCPLAGLIDDEVFDATKELIEIDNHFTRNPEFSNLPRKYKMSVTGCAIWCSQPDINCISLVGVRHPKTSELGFTLKLGGGLSTKPMIAKNFPVFIKREQALEVARAATIVYRDFGFRDKRQKARIKFLVEDWGVDKLLEEIEANLGFKLEHVDKLRDMQTGAAEYFPSPVTSHHDHLGITKLKNGNYAVGVAFISGRTFSPDLANIAELLERFCINGEVRTTNKQNLIILNIPENKLEDLLIAARDYGLRVEHSAFHRLGVACTGTEFCNLAIVETKQRAKDLFNYLDSKFPDFQEQVMISVTGCPNNCAQYSIADIGLVGCKVKNQEGIMEDAFRIFLGGRVGDEAQFGKPLEKRYLHKNIHAVLESLLRHYFSRRQADDSFRAFVDREGIEKIEAEAIS